MMIYKVRKAQKSPKRNILKVLKGNHLKLKVESILNIPPVYIIYSKSMMPLSNILVQAGLVVKPLNYLRLHWQLHFSTIPASLGNRRDKTYL